MTSRAEIFWTEQSASQVRQAYNYIAALSGRTGRTPGTRELVISQTPFIAAYAIEKGSVVILATWGAEVAGGVLSQASVRRGTIPII